MTQVVCPMRKGCQLILTSYYRCALPVRLAVSMHKSQNRVSVFVVHVLVVGLVAVGSNWVCEPGRTAKFATWPILTHSVHEYESNRAVRHILKSYSAGEVIVHWLGMQFFKFDEFFKWE